MTERLRGKDLAVLARESARTPMHNATVEIFEPGDISNAVVWLCTDEARYITGTTLTIDGGTTI